MRCVCHSASSQIFPRGALAVRRRHRRPTKKADPTRGDRTVSEFPSIFRLRQKFEATRVADIAAEVDAQLGKLRLRDTIRSGQSVAITAGSRGIANIHQIIKAAVDHCKRLGAEPFIVPAMGSHGGGTAEGQRQVIESYGITEEFAAARSARAWRRWSFGRRAEGFPVHFDRQAFEADHVLVCNRVKPHTDFAGDIESGLMKMMLIGLGKHDGAKSITGRSTISASTRSCAAWRTACCSSATSWPDWPSWKTPTTRRHGSRPLRRHEFEVREKELLVLAKRWLPRLPFDQRRRAADRRDRQEHQRHGPRSNVVGRKFNAPSVAGEFPKVKRILSAG